LEFCAACDALSAADVQRAAAAAGGGAAAAAGGGAAAAAGGAASVATPPRPPASSAHVDAAELQRYALLAKEQNGSIFTGTVHCELLDYLLTIALQRNPVLQGQELPFARDFNGRRRHFREILNFSRGNLKAAARRKH
jgi:hypothetical protein